MTIVAAVALTVMFTGILIYGWITAWLFPSLEYMTEWSPLDFIVLAITVAIGQTVAAFVGVRLTRRLVMPLTTVTEAAPVDCVRRLRK